MQTVTVTPEEILRLEAGIEVLEKKLIFETQKAGAFASMLRVLANTLENNGIHCKHTVENFIEKMNQPLELKK